MKVAVGSKNHVNNILDKIYGKIEIVSLKVHIPTNLTLVLK